MALIKNIEKIVFGKSIELENVYISIDSISNYKEFMLAQVCMYSDGNKIYKIEEKSYKIEYSLNGENPFKQAYDYLKTLEEFKDAKDC